MDIFKPAIWIFNAFEIRNYAFLAMPEVNSHYSLLYWNNLNMWMYYHNTNENNKRNNSLISVQIKVFANLHRHNGNNKLNENNKLANYLNDHLILHLVIDTFFVILMRCKL